MLGCMTAQPAYAASIGEELVFVADEQKSAQVGSSHTSTQTSSSRTNNAITNYARDIISQIKDRVQCDYIKEHNFVMVWKDEVAIEGIGTIIQTSDRYDEDDGPSFGDKIISGIESNRNELDFFEGLHKPDLGAQVNPDTYPWTDGSQDIGAFIQTLPGTEKVEVPGGRYQLLDFPTYKERYEYIQQYLDWIGESENVKVTYILSYSSQYRKDDAIKVTKALPWPGTNMTHLWDIQCIEAPDDGITRPSLTTIAGNELRQTFYYSGKYHVTATQYVEKQYCEAFTYNVCEYLVLEETGQIIWKNENTGASWVNKDHVNDNTYNVHGFEPYFVERVYVTQYDKIHQVTGNVLIDGDPAINAWQDKYTTVRIE